MITGDFFIRQLPLIGNLNFPAGTHQSGCFTSAAEPVRLQGKKGLGGLSLRLGKKRGMLRATWSGKGEGLNRNRAGFKALVF